MATQPAIQYISDSDSTPVGVIVPIEIWHGIESERETAYLLTTLVRAAWPDFVFAFHEGAERGQKMLARIAKHTGLAPSEL